VNYNAKIIVIAFPDTFVKMSDELICKFLPLVGLGTREYIKAGHAALVLINEETGIAKYFDFGRYVTPNGRGRVRGMNTDVELKIPFNAEFSENKKLENLDKFLLWLDAHPEKTHGSGRILASVCNHINFEKAEKHINTLQSRGNVPYGAFAKEGSNCARFVTDTILASTNETSIIKGLKWNYKFTPSTVGNVEKAACDSTIFEVYEGKICKFEGNALKENLKNYFHKKKQKNNAAHILPILPENAQKLSGIGSNAWFELIKDESSSADLYIIKRYNELHNVDFEGVFYTSMGFSIYKPYEFVYDSHCEYCHVIQEGKTYRFDLLKFSKTAAISSMQKVHSA